MIQELQIAQYRIFFELEPERFASDHHLLWYFQHNQAPEPEVIHVMTRALKAGDCAVDAGANIGFFTILMSKIVGETGNVIAVEPDGHNLAKLHKNLDINGCKNVQVVQCALAADTGRAPLYRDKEDNGKTSVFAIGRETDWAETAELRTLDDVLGEQTPKLLKMDIEGSEVAALRGCSYPFPCILSEVNPKALHAAGTDTDELFALMRNRGYERYLIHGNGTPASRIRCRQRVVTKRENANMMFAMDDYVTTALWPEVEL